LFESASGYALFKVIESEQIGLLLDPVQQNVQDLSKFGATVKLHAFSPFISAESALENINAISEGLVTDELKAFLEMNLPTSKKSGKFSLGLSDKGLAQTLSDTLKIPCNTNETSLELLRGIRLHFTKLVKELGNGNLAKAQLGLGHSYSRAKVKFNVNRADNMIIQSICLLDQMDKDINTFAMRVREWYSWHFPELVQLVSDNFVYAR
jgi:nucleolar protein 56